MIFKKNNMEFQPLEYLYQPSGNPGAYTLLLLHGTGGDERDLLPLAKHFGNDLNVLSLRGNVSEGGMPRFFKRLGMGVFDEQDLAFRTDELVAFIKELAGKASFDINKVIALGYSNGANMIGSMLVRYPDLLSGAILFRPMQPFKVPGDFKSQAGRPVFMSNGAQDPTINPADTTRYIALLQDAGFRVTPHTLSTGHNLGAEDLHLSIEWFQKNFK
jgi:phospholipase/carboxylesterase